jgi:hypothetical protein
MYVGISLLIIYNFGVLGDRSPPKAAPTDRRDVLPLR